MRILAPMLRINLTKKLIRTLLLGTGLVLLLLLLICAPDALSRWTIQKINRYDDHGYIITNIVVSYCSILNLSGCSKGGDWFLVDKDLNYNSKGKRMYHGLWKQKLFVQKKKVLQLTDLDNVIVSTEAGDDGFMYNREKYNPETPEKYFYNLDVLFGLDAVDPRPDWELRQVPLNIITTDMHTYFTFKRNPYALRLPDTNLTVTESKSNYKILQIADLHFGTGEGVCRDQFPEVENCKADKRTLVFLNKVLDLEKPDLAVLTGDQIFGENSFDSMTTIFKVVAPLIERKIPYALMFGNHDEGSLTRQQLMELIVTLPYNLANAGPEGIHGVGNYHFQVNDESSQSVLTFFVLDSHKKRESLNPKIISTYDWIRENQLDYFSELNKTLKYGPRDLKFAFFHIPLPEYKNVEQGFTGNYKEGIVAPNHNSFARDVLQEIGVSVVGVGHDHCNDYCLLDSKKDDEHNKIWLCYGGASGEGGYGGYGGTTRRLRIFDVDLASRTVRSYKRLETSPVEIFDEQILVKNGAVVSQ